MNRNKSWTSTSSISEDEYSRSSSSTSTSTMLSIPIAMNTSCSAAPYNIDIFSNWRPDLKPNEVASESMTDQTQPSSASSDFCRQSSHAPYHQDEARLASSPPQDPLGSNLNHLPDFDPKKYRPDTAQPRASTSDITSRSPTSYDFGSYPKSLEKFKMIPDSRATKNEHPSRIRSVPIPSWVRRS